MIQENSIYIAGPMTGIVDHNFPAFHAAAKKLRAQGYAVFNPAEINADAVDVIRPWSWYMRKDLAELVKCEAIYLLPGWENSKGATLEMHVAERLGMTIVHAPKPSIFEQTKEDARRQRAAKALYDETMSTP